MQRSGQHRRQTARFAEDAEERREPKDIWGPSRWESAHRWTARQDAARKRLKDFRAAKREARIAADSQAHDATCSMLTDSVHSAAAAVQATSSNDMGFIRYEPPAAPDARTTALTLAACAVHAGSPRGKFTRAEPAVSAAPLYVKMRNPSMVMGATDTVSRLQVQQCFCRLRAAGCCSYRL